MNLKPAKRLVLDCLNNIRHLPSIVKRRIAVALFICILMYHVVTNTGQLSIFLFKQTNKQDKNTEENGSEIEKMTILQVDNRYERDINISELIKTQNWTEDSEYWDQTRVINKIYAHKHNYSYLSIKSNATGFWEPLKFKVKATSNYLMHNPGVDWVFFIDSDAYVGDDAWNLKMAKEYFNMTDAVHMLFTSDPDPRHGVNTGVYFVRNSAIGREMMSAWDKSIQKNEKHCDQKRFNEVIMSNETYSKYVRLDSKQYFANLSGKRKGGHRDAFVQHYTGGDKISRKKEIKRFVIDLLNRPSTKHLYKQ